MSRFGRISGWLPGLSLNLKLVVSFLVLGLAPALAIGWYGFQSSANQLQDAAGRLLEEAATTDGETIDRNLFERYGDVQAFAANPKSLGSTAERQEIVDFLMVNYGIYDLMLIVDLEGQVLTANGVDGSGEAVDTSSLVGSDVSNEEWFEVVAGGETPAGGTYYTDAHMSDRVADIYEADLLTLPFTAPIHDAQGRVVAVWHNEASFQRVVGDVMSERRRSFAAQGLETIETQVLRSDGTVIDDADPTKVDELNLVEAGLAAAAGATVELGARGFIVENHIRTGVEQINGFAATDGALGFDGYEWGILVRQDVNEAAAAAAALRGSMAIMGLVAAFVIVVVGLLLARSLSNPLKRSLGSLQRVSDGDLTVRLDVRTSDEVGHMADALNSALGSIDSTLTSVDSSVSDLTGSAADLGVVSRNMAGAASDASGQATEVAAATEEISVSSQSVVQAMDQMRAAIEEISTSTSGASELAFRAVEVTHATEERMSELDASAASIGSVVDMITTIAEQTNLLALNATIEAARAGESGKGFAVVANEVKDLATQTGAATEEIRAKVETIQSGTDGAVQAINEIINLVDEVRDATTTIASAVEEQSVTTADVSSSLMAVTEGTTSISDRIASVVSAAEATTAGSTETLNAASHLNDIANHLSDLLERFELTTTTDADPHVDRAAPASADHTTPR